MNNQCFRKESSRKEGRKRGQGEKFKGTYLSYLSNLDETLQVSGIDRDQVYFVSIVVLGEEGGKG
jgi:hypothetical protein